MGLRQSPATTVREDLVIEVDNRPYGVLASPTESPGERIVEPYNLQELRRIYLPDPVGHRVTIGIYGRKDFGRAIDSSQNVAKLPTRNRTRSSVHSNVLFMVVYAAGFGADAAILQGSEDRVPHSREARDILIITLVLNPCTRGRWGGKGLVTVANYALVPKSYSIVKPVAQLTDEYISLPCVNCQKDLLAAPDAEGIFGLIEEPSEDTAEILDVFWACRGECGQSVEARRSKGYGSTWEEISDLLIPASYLRFCLVMCGNIRAGRQRWSDTAFDNTQHFLIALVQRVFREMTERERQRFKDNVQLLELFGC